MGLVHRSLRLNHKHPQNAVPPLVSILVPSYNTEAFLVECLESALGQTYPNIEVIVVDDGSTDGSLALARSFEPRGVQVVTQANQGQAAAINTAFKVSHGDYIQYLDADDVLDARKIEVQMNRLLQAEPTAIAAGAWARFGVEIETDMANALFRHESVWQDMDPVEWVVASWTGGGIMHVAGWLIPRAVALAAGPWKDSLRWASNLDSHFFTRAVLASSRYLFCREAMTYYRSGHYSMSNWKSRRNVEATLQVVTETGGFLLGFENSPRTRRAFADRLQEFAYTNYPDNPDLVQIAEARIKELGGSRRPVAGGPVKRILSRLLGWKMGKRLHQMVRR